MKLFIKMQINLNLNDGQQKKRKKGKLRVILEFDLQMLDSHKIPFGFGPRSCVGSRIAQNEIYSFTARILQDYRLKPSDPSLKIRGFQNLLYVPMPTPQIDFYSLVIKMIRS